MCCRCFSMFCKLTSTVLATLIFKIKLAGPLGIWATAMVTCPYKHAIFLKQGISAFVTIYSVSFGDLTSYQFIRSFPNGYRWFCESVMLIYSAKLFANVVLCYVPAEFVSILQPFFRRNVWIKRVHTLCWTWIRIPRMFAYVRPRSPTRTKVRVSCVWQTRFDLA